MRIYFCFNNFGEIKKKIVTLIIFILFYEKISNKLVLFHKHQQLIYCTLCRSVYSHLPSQHK